MYLGCCGDDDGLGLAILPALSAVTSLFGGPKDTTGTKTFIGGLLTRALAGDTKADHQIRCLAGDKTYNAEFNATSGAGCGYAHPEDRAVAQQAVDVLNGTSSSYIPSSGASFVPPTVNVPIVGQLSTTPLILAGVAAVAIVVLSQRGRR